VTTNWPPKPERPKSVFREPDAVDGAMGEPPAPKNKLSMSSLPIRRTPIDFLYLLTSAKTTYL
jgi:hypothetical protein